MSATATHSPTIADATLTIRQEIRVQASIEATFAALLEQLGPAFSTPDGVSMQTKIEPWPGGRWYRDLGNQQGHYWATVQAIKSPVLLEFCGPLMMSAAVVNNIQYRLRAEGKETVIEFHHFGFGLIPEGMGDRMPEGWRMIHERAKQQAESGKR